MPHPHASDATRSLYATSSAPSYYGDARQASISKSCQLVKEQQLLPVPWLDDIERPPNELPPHTPAGAREWQARPNRSRRALLTNYGQPDEVRVGLDEFGEITVYDAGVPLRFLNAQASEFCPTEPERPASALSIRSSRSATSSSAYAHSFATDISSVTSATSLSATKQTISDCEPLAPMRPSPGPSLTPIPVHHEPGEVAYRAYRDLLSREPDVTGPINCILETGVSGYDLTQHMVVLASRLSAHAPCGPGQFKALLRVAALEMFHSYWGSSDGPWRTEPVVTHQYLVSRGINIAGLMGSLLRYAVISGSDVHICLDVLLSTGPIFLKLQAAHAAVMRCGERICAGDMDRTTALVRRRLNERGPDGRLLWGPHDPSHVLLLDLLNDLDRWSEGETVSQISPGFSAPSTARASPATPRRMRLSMHSYGR
ncbi:hypothetical protein B0H17DRAFT_1197668 [Mycena rosella]|uniref:Uncharacterized protein n=1 Tax=Mycena rosella TaxID=1033263 RepID=A0AAD7DSA6_MYCRO|nr:hypothetical protein B0H17DRAFT_1197668 [Mycena rosella]